MVFNHHTLPFLPGNSFIDRLSYSIHVSGEFGVCVFFMLSAFLITELLLRERETAGTVYLQKFYLRRVLRIWPPYLFTLFLIVLLPASHPHSAFAWHRVFMFLLFAGNWSIVLHGWIIPLYFSALWTISLEEQFYIVWPSVAKLWGPGGIGVMSCSFLALSIAALIFEAQHHVYGDTRVWCDSLVQFQYFSLGGLTALFLHNRVIRLSFLPRFLIFAAACGCMLTSNFAFHLYHGATLRQELCGLLLLDTGVVALFFSFSGASIPHWMSPLTYLGKISYGLYLYQLLVAYYVEEWMRAHGVERGAAARLETYILVAAGTLAVSSFSYQYVEKPFLRLKRHFELVKTRSA